MLHKRIRKLRESKNLLQADISKYLNITRESYSMYETGKRQMSFDTLCRLANHYEVSTDYLLGRQDTLIPFLNDEERQVIEQYRSLDEHAKESIKNSLNFETSRKLRPNNIKTG